MRGDDYVGIRTHEYDQEMSPGEVVTPIMTNSGFLEGIWKLFVVS